MAGRKIGRRQVTFESALEPAVALDPRVVLAADPRWAAGLEEMKACPFAGLDSEFYDNGADAGGDADEDGEGNDGLDPYTASLRLVQVALPSGICLVADFGGIGDDRAERFRFYGHEDSDRHVIDGVAVDVPRFRPGSFLWLLRELCESRKRLKILHHAKIDALMLRIHLGIRCRGLRCTMLLSQHYWAGIKGWRHGLGAVSARAVAAGAPGVWLVEKRLQQSEWRWLLSPAQLNYAALDAIVVLAIYRWLAGKAKDDGMMDSALAEMGAIVGFVECEVNGLPLNPAALDDHLEIWRRARAAAIEPFRRRYPDVDPAKTREVAVAMTYDDCYGGHVFFELDESKPSRRPYFILGKRFDFSMKKQEMRGLEKSPHSVAEHVLVRFAHLPWVDALMDWRSMGIALKWLEAVRSRMRRDGRVRGEYSQIAGGESRGAADKGTGRGMGRSSCKAPGLQVAANPQPKINRIIAGAMRWPGEALPMSPRLPFVPHDEAAASYLRWMAARLRGRAPDPLQHVPQPLPEGPWTKRGSDGGGAAAASRGAFTDAAWGSPGPVSSEADGDDEAEEVFAGPALGFGEADLEARARWLEGLAVEWERDPRAFVVADFSQAHMRIAAQASGDPQLCEDFRAGRDAHLKLAFDFGVAQGLVDRLVAFDEFNGWYKKGHKKYKLVKELRKPAKTGNYTSLNMGSVDRLKEAGDTAPEPVSLPREGWELIRKAWRARYAVLFAYQKQHVAACNVVDVVIDGEHYGVAWTLRTGRRLYLKKEPDKYDRDEPRHCGRCGKTHGKLTVKGTDAVSFRWMGSEACAIKWAMDRIVEEFDAHDAYFMIRGLVAVGDVWDAKLGSMAHDEVDVDCRRRYVHAVAACVRKWFRESLIWCGVDSIPVEEPGTKDENFIVNSWADK